MPAPKVSDAEFIELFKTHGSARKVAQILDSALPGIHARRRAVEQRYNIQIDAHAHPERSQYYKHLSPRQHSAWQNIEVKNGVVIVFSDAHFWPGVRTTAFRGLLKLCKDLQPKVVVCNGDAFDGASISRYPRIGWDSKPSVLEELKACEESLSLIEDVAGRAKLVWPLGNHDSRYETRLAANAPQYEGINGFHIKDHFPAWAPCWALRLNGDTVVKHRYKGGIHATHNNTVNSGQNIVTGHLHSLKVTPFSDYNGTRFGVDTGTLADTAGPQFEDYQEASPANHRSGFAVLTFHKGRLLWPEIAHAIEENYIQFRGQVIKC
jgi:hypothetical protein